ncbi:MAG: hypothetical protein KatS3mg049_2527 [Caldilinea sp.]|jgi:hypothetical protein|nr:MAG: hypothetical protein KatS3mg049_2527 [Caldilinea sp.]
MHAEFTNDFVIAAPLQPHRGLIVVVFQPHPYRSNRYGCIATEVLLC